MKLADVTPAHCYANAHQLLARLEHVRDEMGRTADPRPVPEISGAKPREVYFQAIAAWHKVARLGDELGACTSRAAPAIPAIDTIAPGHCLELIDAIGAQVDDIVAELGITAKAAAPALEPSRQPSDVLVTLVKVNRMLSRLLERPMAPADCYRTVALALAYARRTGRAAVDLAKFERAKQPADCYRQLETCLATLGKKIAARGQTALTARASLPDATPSDVFDLANLVLGEVAYLHALAGTAAPVHAFEPGGHGHRLPAHVYQLAHTLDAQLATI